MAAAAGGSRTQAAGGQVGMACGRRAAARQVQIEAGRRGSRSSSTTTTTRKMQPGPAAVRHE